MGAGSKEAVPFLRQLLKDSDDKDVLVAALSAADLITNDNQRSVQDGRIGAAIPLDEEEMKIVAKKLKMSWVGEDFRRAVETEYDMVYPQEDKNLGGGGFY
jgi:hypothetical protein